MNPKLSMPKWAYITGFCFLCVFCFISCSVRQDVELTRQGSGTADISIELNPMLTRYFTDLMEFAGDENSETIFDTAAIRGAFREIPELDLIDVHAPSKGELYLRIAFTDIEQAFFRQIGTDVIPAAEVTQYGNNVKTNLYLDTENYNKIVERILVLTGMVVFDDYLTALLEPGPEEVILDIYEYAFEDYAVEDSVETVLRQSDIIVKFTVPEMIGDHRGGKVEGRSITYTVPLFDILTLDDPIFYNFIYH